MEVLLRLRLLIWLLIFGLWGVLVYQYLYEENGAAPQAHYLSNPFRDIPPPQPDPSALAAMGFAAGQAERKVEANFPPGSAALREGPHPGETASPGSISYIRPLSTESAAPTQPVSQAQPVPPIQAEEARPAVPVPAIPAPADGGAKPATTLPPPPREEAAKLSRSPIPSGFVETKTRHFAIYSEEGPALESFVEMIETLHGNIMLDLASFTPWADDERVTILLFRNESTYRKVTGRPAWSGGASVVSERRVYIYRSGELPGILAHELCHVYYDNFYRDGRADPLWLSEGMATLTQVERGLAAPEWLRDNLDVLKRGGGYDLERLMGMTSLAGLSDVDVQLWYAECYSLVRFLVRKQQNKSGFYKFSEYMREGKDARQSLYRAFGMPLSNLRALETAWRADLGGPRAQRLSLRPLRPLF